MADTPKVQYVTLEGLQAFLAGCDSRFVAQEDGYGLSQNDLTDALLADLNRLKDIEVINNLTSSSTSDALSAAQGKVLKGLIDAIELALAGGVGDMFKAEYDPTDAGYVAKAAVAMGLETAFDLDVIGDAEGTVSIDGTGDVNLAVTLSETGITSGTYTKVTIGSDGRASAGTTLGIGDLPDSIPTSKIDGLGTAASKNIGTGAGEIPVLGSDGKWPSSTIPVIELEPPIASVATEADLVTVTEAKKGDSVTVNDTGDVWQLIDDDPTEASNWIKRVSGSLGVTAWNGKTGSIVPTTDDVAEAGNKYYTDGRVNARIALAKVEDLSDGDQYVKFTDLEEISALDIAELFE